MEKMEVEFGKKARIELKSAVGTPFRWELMGEDDNLKSDIDFQICEEKQTPQLKSVFTFAAKKPGTYKVDFSLSAPFVGRPISRKAYEITFK
jgi:predicted secreted protein